MSPAASGRDLDELLDELEEALGELRERLPEPDYEHSHDEAQETARPTVEVAIAAAAAALEANARALALLARAIGDADRSGRDRGHHLGEPQDRLDRALDELGGVVDDEVPAPAQGLLTELRRLNAEIAARLDARVGEEGGREVEIAVESELESIRDELEAPEG